MDCVGEKEGLSPKFIFVFISKELCRILVMIKGDVLVGIFGSDCFYVRRPTRRVAVVV